MIVLAGDSIDDDPYFESKLLDGVGIVPHDMPVVAVLGNHEMYGDPHEAIAKLRASRVHLLLNEGMAIGQAPHPRSADPLPASGARDSLRRRPGEGLVWLAGISDYAARLAELRPNMEAAIAGRGARFPVVIAHQPKAFDDARRLHLPLTICAHTHGGQLGFRPLRWSLAGLFLPYHMGLYERDGSQLYVNTGTGYWLLPFRLGITPEITLIELRRR